MHIYIIAEQTVKPSANEEFNLLLSQKHLVSAIVHHVRIHECNGTGNGNFDNGDGAADVEVDYEDISKQ